MKRVAVRVLTSLIVMLLTLPAWGGDKEKDQETVKNATTVLQDMLSSKAVPADLLAKADCVIVLPSVKKFGLGVGGSGGRGPISCRSGKNFEGKWSAPAMLTVGGVSAGLQVGGSSSDFVLLVMTEKAVNTILDQKTKLGTDATAAAGPSGATTGSPVGGDVLTYGRAKGLFAGVSLGGASLEADNDANKRTYGKPISVRDIVRGSAVKTPAGQQELITLLDNKAGKHRVE
ncbi:MAG TPA: lipid-binding SYLF domain-containing protein [Terriglobales bacterium]|jgi:lipid-binding SYLF domain-containing protein|nr:lipid-binding SYLF domain-containing protein [Terriglobales bacterium]